MGREQEYEANYSHLMELYQTKNFEHQEFLFGYIRVRYNYAHYLVSKGKNIMKPSKKLLRRLNSVNKDRQATKRGSPTYSCRKCWSQVSRQRTSQKLLYRSKRVM